MKIVRERTESGSRAYIQCNYLERFFIDRKIARGLAPNIFAAKFRKLAKGGIRSDYVVTSKVHTLRNIAKFQRVLTSPKNFGIMPTSAKTLDYRSENVTKAISAVESQLRHPKFMHTLNTGLEIVIKIEVMLDIDLTVREKARLQHIYQEQGWSMAVHDKNKFYLVYVEVDPFAPRVCYRHS